jgi:hypothetical protein
VTIWFWRLTVRAGRLLHHIGQRLQLEVFHALAGEDGDRLRGLAQRQRQAGGGTAGACGRVAARAFGGAVRHRGGGRHLHFSQRGCAAAAALGGFGMRRSA